MFRSERIAAIALVIAAIAGLSLANSAAGPQAVSALNTRFGLPDTVWWLPLGSWISEGILVLFFFTAAIELRHELTSGQLRTRKAAALPAAAAAGGVLLPILIFLAFTGGSGQERGWPIPTATDIAFALGILALVGRGLPGRLRAFILALAILDDIVGIVIIAVVFAQQLSVVPLVIAVLAVTAFALIGLLLQSGAGRASRHRHHSRIVHGLLIALLIVTGVAAWSATLASGIHPTIAGVALGLVLPAKPAGAAAHRMQPAVNAVVLPVFAFTASLVVIPSVSFSQLQPAFWGVLFGLPLGKLAGVMIATAIADRILTADRGKRMSLGDLVSAGALAGIGFTVSLLMSSLAFREDAALLAESTLAVLLGSAISAIAAIVIVGYRARSARHRTL